MPALERALHVVVLMLLQSVSCTNAEAKCFIKCVTIHPPHINPPPVNIPHVNLPGGVSLTPAGPAPTSAVNQANDILNKAVQQVAPAANAAIEAGTKSLAAQTAPLQGLGKVIAGESTLGDAAKDVVHAEGAKYTAIGETISQINASDKNIQVIAAESIGGKVGKTVMTISNGTDRLNIEFVATALIAGGNALQGVPLDRVVAAPLAARLIPLTQASLDVVSEWLRA